MWLAANKVRAFAAGLIATAVLPAVRAAGTDGVATPESWPMFRGNPGLTGISPAKLPQSFSLLWTYKTAGPVKSSAAIAGGKVFVGSDDKQLHCIDLKTGKRIWAFPTEAEIESSPLILGRAVYFGSADGVFHAVDAAGGKKVWDFKTGDKILGAPNWVDAPDQGKKWVLAGSYDYKLYCFDASTGQTNWTYETSNYINGSPAVAQGQTVFGGCDALLHVISLKDGRKIKEIEAGAYIAGSGAFEAGRFYIGHYENEFICADLNAGNIAWRFKDRPFPYFSSPALTRDLVIFGGRDKRVHCVRKQSGEPVWSFATRAKVDSSPVVCGDRVIVGSGDGSLYVLNLRDGKEVWSHEVGDALTSSPAVVNGVVVIGSEDGNIYAFGGK